MFVNFVVYDILGSKIQCNNKVTKYQSMYIE